MFRHSPSPRLFRPIFASMPASVIVTSQRPSGSTIVHRTTDSRRSGCQSQFCASSVCPPLRSGRTPMAEHSGGDAPASSSVRAFTAIRSGSSTPAPRAIAAISSRASGCAPPRRSPTRSPKLRTAAAFSPHASRKMRS